MHAASRSAIAALAVVGALGTWVIVGAGQAQPPQSPAPLPLEPLGVRGEALYAAFEGWGPTKDGKEVLLFGYYNRNQDQVLDIPIGPNNMIEPAGPDVGQPTHFLTRRQYGLFAIEVPKDFGNKRYTWTLNANGQKTQVTGWKNPPYWIDFYQNTANGNETPVMRFTEDGPALQGPVVGWSQSLNAKANEPLALNVWVTDKPSNEPEGRGAQPPATTTADAGRGARGADPAAAGARGGRGAAAGGGGGGGGGGRGGEPRGDVTILWQKYRGPGEVKFSEERSLLFNKRDAKLVMRATTQATFAQPGEYAIVVTANDQSGPGGGGDQCCWTSARIRVTVK